MSSSNVFKIPNGRFVPAKAKNPAKKPYFWLNSLPVNAIISTQNSKDANNSNLNAVKSQESKENIRFDSMGASISVEKQMWFMK